MFQGDDNDRQASLDQARLAAALTKPWILPRRGQRPNEEMPMNYQSVGSRGVSILAGKLLLAIYPAGVPWFVLVPAARLRNNPNVPPDAIQESQQDLFLYAQSLMAELESTDVSPDIDLRRRLLGFRSHKLRTLEQLLVTGDSLEMLDRQFRMHLFRRGSYVTKRDGSGAVLYHITKERIDVADLGQEKYQLSQLPPELLEEVFPRERIKDLYTWVRWQPEQRNWHIQQEVNGNLINESEEQISPYISTPYELTDDDYGRGFVEQNLGDIRSLDELELRRLDLLALAAKELIGKDPASLVRDDDLKQRPGSIVPGVRMINGVAQDIGPIGFANIRDFQMLTAGVLDKRQDLSKAMFIE